MHTSCTHPAGQQNNVLAHIMVETCLHLPRLASTCLARIIIIISIIIVINIIIIIALVLISRLELPTLA